MPRPLDYVRIPDGAQLLLEDGAVEEHTIPLPPTATLPVSPPDSLPPSAPSAPSSPNPTGHRSTSSFLVSQTLTQVLNLPALPADLATGKTNDALLTSKYPLSLPITTVNFRRFVARSGAIFWFQDRVEEIILWKRGQQYTFSFMSAYAFLCQCLALLIK